MTSLKTASALALSLLLVACGGGGGGAASTTDTRSESVTTPLVTSSVTGVDTHYFGISDVNTVTSNLVETAPNFSHVNSLNDFTLNDSFGDSTSQLTFNAAVVIPAPDIYDGSTNNSATTFSIGGTTWSYARFGIFNNTVITGINQYTTRHTPFFAASVYSTEALSDATYATNGYVVGYRTLGGNGFEEMKCSVSAAYTHSSQELELTLSSCVGKDSLVAPNPVNGGTGTIRLNPAGISANGFSFLRWDPLFQAVNVLSSGYKLAGPEGQELVGAITLTTGGDLFTFAFGIKK
jgi:hypothetical protein